MLDCLGNAAQGDLQAFIGRAAGAGPFDEPLCQGAGDVLRDEGLLAGAGLLALIFHILLAQQLDELMRHGGGERHPDEVQNRDAAHGDGAADGGDLHGELGAAERVERHGVLFEVFVNRAAVRSTSSARLS